MAKAKTIAQVEAKLDEEVDKRAEPKTLESERLHNGLWRAKWTAGGNVPDILKSAYTSKVRCDQAIAIYLSKKADAEKQPQSE